MHNNLSSVIFEENENSEGETIESVDFAILYSEPLVRTVKEKNNNGEMAIVTHKPVDFMTECNSIVDILKNMNKGVHLYLKCLREESFKKAIKKNPKILHLICHGGFNQKNEFYLEFEAENAVLLPYNKKDLRRIIKENPKIKNIELLFINACFSEEIAEIFLDSGVGCVVSIQRETKIVDKISKDFSKHFYSGILSCQTIKDSFNSAIESIKSHYKNQKSSYHSCCCSHLHKDDCLWASKTRSFDFTKAHNEHTPIFPLCKCKNRYRNLHEHCKWSTFFLMRYRHEKSPQYKLVGNEKFICCCSLDLPHDETLKFKLRYRNDDKSLGDKKIFYNLKQNGTVKIVNFDNFGNNIFFDQERIIGFNLYIYRIFQYLVIDKKKVILLKGKTGSGKTSLAKKFTNYSNERKSFDFIKYIDFYKNNCFFNFESNLKSVLQSMKGYNKKKQIYAYKKILLILDNMDILIKKDVELLNHKIKYYVEKYNLYLIIISEIYENDNNNILNNFYENRMTIRIKPLSKETGAKIFLSICKNSLGEYTGNYYNLIQNDEFNEIYDEVDFYPRNIIKLANLIVDQDNIDLDNVLKEYKAINSDVRIRFQKNLNKDKIISNNKFMYFLARLPKGLIFEIDIFDYKDFEGTTETENFLKFISKEVDNNTWKLKKYESQNLLTKKSIDLEDITFDRRFSSSNHQKNIKKNIIDLTKSISNLLENLNQKEDDEENILKLKYFTLTKSLKKMNFIIIRRNQYLQNIVEVNNTKSERFHSMVNIIKFLNSGLTSILKSIKKKNTYYSKITSFSALEDYGDWNIYTKSNEKVENLNNYEFLFYQTHHLNNVIYFIMNKELMEKLLIIAKELSEENDFFDLIEDFIMKFLTVIRCQKNYQDKKNKLLKFYTSIFTWMNSINVVSENFLKLQMKIHIFIISYLYENYNDLSNDKIMQQIETEMNTMDILISTNKRDEINELILHKYEYILLKLYIKGNSSYRNYDYGKNLKEMRGILENFKQRNYHSLVMRMLYVILNYQIKKHDLVERTLYEIENYLNKKFEPQEDFIKFKLCILMHAIYDKNPLKSKVYLDLANNLAYKYNTEDFISGLKELKDDYFENTKCIKNKRLLFLISSPLANILTETSDFSVDFKPYLKLKSLLFDSLKNKKKKIFLDFDILTEINLNKYILDTGGCKVCCLYFNHSIPNSYFMESENFEGKIYFNNLKLIDFFKKAKGLIDLLILVNPFSENLICKQLYNYIPNIIYFNPNVKEYPNSLWLKKLINRFIINFLLIFFDEFVEGNSIYESYEIASEGAHQDLVQYEKKKYIIDIFFSNKKLHCKKKKAKDVIEDIFLKAVRYINNEKLEQINIVKFEFGEISSNFIDLDRNFFDFSSYFVGRQHELKILYKKITNKMTIIISGKEGVGKTFLIKEYLYRAYSLNLYEYKIIMYSEEDYDQINNSINNELEIIEKNNYPGFIKNQVENDEQIKIPKILIVLDDFKSNYIKDISNINWNYFFEKLDLCLIIVSRENQIDLSPQIFKFQRTFTLDPFYEKDSLDFILAILEEDKLIEVPDNFNRENYVLKKVIEKCQGFPKLLSNQKNKEIKKILSNLKCHNNHKN